MIFTGDCNMENIEWRAVAGFPGYEVSSSGEVRSLARMVERRSKTGNLHLMPKPAKIVTPIVKENEYLDVRLYLDGKAHHRYVHRLVATAFIGEPPFEDAEVMHKDDCRSNNNVSNLKWGTHRENECDKLRKVRQARGSRQGLSILSEDSVVKIADDLRNGVLVKEIASKFGIDARNVKHIRDGNSWSHVTGIKKSRKTLID